MAKILVIGSGGREHALCWQLRQSFGVEQVFCAPGNAGIAQDATCVQLSTHADILTFCKQHSIDLVVIGPEQPLVDGLVDELTEAGILTFGPKQNAARLEGSKAFTKEICAKYGIPTADYGTFTDIVSAKSFLKGKAFPIVIKADGLAAGKGVVIATTMQEALDAVESIMGGQFGESGKVLVIEEFLEGEEVSFFALSDGKKAFEFGHAQDHKRAYDGDTGPNTGGMGTYAPSALMTDSLRKLVMERIIQPTIDAMQNEGCPFNGMLFAGLMLTSEGPKLLEYNTRFGDPETQVMMARFTGNFYQVLRSCCLGTLDPAQITFSKDAAICVVMAAKGYPATYQKGTPIAGLEKAAALERVHIFHAGTSLQQGIIVSNGGRVLGVTATGNTIADAQAHAYRAVDTIDWPEGFCRRDIGWRAMKKVS